MAPGNAGSCLLLALRRLRQRDCEVQTSLGYRVNAVSKEKN